VNPLSISLDVSSVPPKPAGAGRYVFELAKGLVRHDSLHTTLIARGNDAFRWEGVGGTVAAVVPQSRPHRLLWEQTRLSPFLRKHNITVHHAPHYTMPERAKTPVVVTIHDMTFFDNPEWHEKSKVYVFQRAIKAAVKRASALIAVSSDTAARVRNRFGDVDITVIPHGVDHLRFNPDAIEGERDELSKAGVPDEYIAFVGTIEPRKNLPSLIRAFDKIAKQHPSLHLVIAGQRGWALEEFDRALEASPNQSRIVLPGYLSEPLIPALLRNARAVAYPSLAEGFGLPALEALACGAPLVAGSGSALDEVTNGGAILIDQHDVDALADGLRQALDEDRDVASKKGPQAALLFTWESAVTKHIDVYRRVTQR
jgi:glycosyltransferase involved in cell wall biosynthesis